MNLISDKFSICAGFSENATNPFIIESWPPFAKLKSSPFKNSIYPEELSSWKRALIKFLFYVFIFHFKNTFSLILANCLWIWNKNIKKIATGAIKIHIITPVNVKTKEQNCSITIPLSDISSSSFYLVLKKYYYLKKPEYLIWKYIQLYISWSVKMV